MKKIIYLLAILICTKTNATTYYVSLAGSDGNSGTSTGSPWQSISKVNSFSFSAGDSILFRRGDTFYGTIAITHSGTTTSPIVYSAYGSGLRPVISGFATVSGWTSLGRNKYESSSKVSPLAYTNMVVINGVNTPMGRTPNSGYYTYTAHTGLASQGGGGATGTLTSSVTPAAYWSSSWIAFNVTTYTVDNVPITSISGNTISLKESSTFDINNNGDESIQKDNQGFIIQNNLSTLDSLNEWYYNPTTGKITVYNTTTPSNVLVDTLQFLLVDSGFANHDVTITNMAFQGANSYGIYVKLAKNITITNCDFNYMGKGAIYNPYAKSGTVSGKLDIENNTFNNINNTAINSRGDNPKSVISYNNIKNVGLYFGMIQPFGNTAEGIYNGSDSVECLNNIVDSTGYNNISLFGNYDTAFFNLLNHSCLVNTDGGNLYINNHNQTSGITAKYNICLNSHNNGIYADNSSTGVEIAYNSVYGANDWGIYVNNGNQLSIHDNTTFKCGIGMLINAYYGTGISNTDIRKNIFFASPASQYTASYSFPTSVSSTLTEDSNYYAKPINELKSIGRHINTIIDTVSLATWQSYSSKDAHSNITPKTITDTSDLLFVYNATSSPVTSSLAYDYIDVKNQPYDGSITLAPWSSAVLIKVGGITPVAPTANAGFDQQLTLPVSTVNLYGNSSDPNGNVTSYLWTKIAGPSTYTITNASAAGTTVTGLVQGIYQFQLKVTDASDSIGLDTIQVTVNASGTLLPAIPTANLVSGSLNYNYYEAPGTYVVLPYFYSLTPVKSGTTATFATATLANRTINYAFNYTGFIDIPSDGQYTFYTNSGDGSNLYIDNALVVLNDSTHGSIEISGVIGLKAGKHAISVGYFQYTGYQNFSVYYSSSTITKQTIPSSALYHILPDSLKAASAPSATWNGIDYSYYQSSVDYTIVPDFSALTPVKSGVSTNVGLYTANRTYDYSYNFTGYVNIPYDGQDTFYINSDDGSNLYVDNILVVNNDGYHAATELSGVIALKAGKHIFRVSYFQNLGSYVLNVSFAGPGIPKQAIPQFALNTGLAHGSYGVAFSNPFSRPVISSMQSSVKVFPNPFSNYFDVHITDPAAGEYDLVLTDATGRTIWTRKLIKGPGTLDQSVGTTNLPKGMYFLRVIKSEKNSTIKLIK